MQERNGELSETIKTASGAREIPPAPTLSGVVGAGRFELPTPCPPGRCANQAALRSAAPLLPRAVTGVNGKGRCA